MSEEFERLRTYLGDSVYVEFDGYYFVLTTNNGYPDDPRNIICMEPEVYFAFTRWVDRLKNEIYKKKTNAS